MLTFEFKIKANSYQYHAIDDLIRIGQFIRNKCLRYWLDAPKEEKVNLSVLCKYVSNVLSKDINFPFVNKLNSGAAQASVDRIWLAIKRFYENCKSKKPGKKGFPKFKKARSVEFKTSGWKLSNDRKYLTINNTHTYKSEVGILKLIGTYDLHYYQIEQIKRVRLIRKVDGYYAQFCIDQDRKEDCNPTDSQIGLDVGLESFYTDSNGLKIENPRFLRKSEKKLKRLQRRISKCKKESNNRKKACKRLGTKHLKVSRQRKDFAIKQARCVMISNNIVCVEKLNIKSLVKNNKLAKSISDVSWSFFKNWLEYYAKVFEHILVEVDPKYTSQDCNVCGNRVKKSLSERTHICACGCVLDRDENAAINILNKGLLQLEKIQAEKQNTVGHTEIKDSGQSNRYFANESLQNKLSG